MRKPVDWVVEKLGKAAGQVGDFGTLSTISAKYLTSQVFFMRLFYTAFNQPAPVFQRAFWPDYNQLARVLSTASTETTNNTKLIKDLDS